MGLFFSGSYNQMAQAEKDTKVYQMNGNNAVESHTAANAASSHRDDGEIAGYVDFLVGELETVKKAAVEKIKQKNDEIQTKDQLMQEKDQLLREKDQLLREKENALKQKTEELREVHFNLQSKENELKNQKFELQMKENQLQGLMAEKKELEKKLASQDRNMLEKVDLYKRQAMAEIQKEKDQVRAARYDLSRYVNKIKEARTKMLAEYKAIGSLLKGLSDNMSGLSSVNAPGDSFRTSEDFGTEDFFRTNESNGNSDPFRANEGNGNSDPFRTNEGNGKSDPFRTGASFQTEDFFGTGNSRSISDGFRSSSDGLFDFKDTDSQKDNLFEL